MEKTQFDTLMLAITGLDTKLSDRITALDTKLSSQITALDTKLSSQITALDTKLSSQITALDTKLTGACRDIVEIRKDLKAVREQTALNSEEITALSRGRSPSA